MDEKRRITREIVKLGSTRRRRRFLRRVAMKLNLDKFQRVPFYSRPDSGGDRSAIKQVLGDLGYDFSAFKQTSFLEQYYATIKQHGKIPLIIDAGANIGATSLYYSMKYPESHIVSIEPEKDNFEILTLNCGEPNVERHQKAVACSPGTVFLIDPQLSDVGFRTGSSGEYPVDCITINQILLDHPAEAYLPFICKIDIEGGEQNLFSDNYEWLSKFPFVVVEPHDWLLPGEANSRNLLKALSELNFDVLFQGENLCCFNNDILSPAETASIA